MTNTQQQFRNFFKENNIKAKVRKVSRGKQNLEIMIDTIKYGLEFTEEEQFKIRSFAVSIGATWVRNLPIDVNRHTDPYDFNFHFNYR